MRYIARIILFSVAVVTTAIIWWRLWFYHGWIGTPRILHRFVPVSGEASYDLTLLEMLVLCAVFFAIMAMLWRLYHGRAEQRE